MGDIKANKKEEIEKKVLELLQAYHLEDNDYFDIVDFVKSDGFLVQSANLGKETTGYLAVNDKENVDDRGYNKLIVVNEKFNNPDGEEDVILKKSRFIIAHEYAHYILHKPSNQSIYAKRDTGHRTNPVELEADYFARSILMPAKSFLKTITALEIFQIEVGLKDEDFHEFKLYYIGNRFKVTMRKAEKRLEDVELLKSIIS